MSIVEQSSRIPGVLVEPAEGRASLDFEDIQHFLMSRPPARAARYEFLTFRSATRYARWFLRHDDSEATTTTENQGASGIYDGARRRLLFPARD